MAQKITDRHGLWGKSSMVCPSIRLWEHCAGNASRQEPIWCESLFTAAFLSKKEERVTFFTILSLSLCNCLTFYVSNGNNHRPMPQHRDSSFSTIAISSSLARSMAFTEAEVLQQSLSSFGPMFGISSSTERVWPLVRKLR